MPRPHLIVPLLRVMLLAAHASAVARCATLPMAWPPCWSYAFSCGYAVYPLGGAWPVAMGAFVSVAMGAFVSVAMGAGAGAAVCAWPRKRAVQCFRVGISLDSVRLTTRTMHPHGACVRGAKRN